MIWPRGGRKKNMEALLQEKNETLQEKKLHRPSQGEKWGLGLSAKGGGGVTDHFLIGLYKGKEFGHPWEKYWEALLGENILTVLAKEKKYMKGEIN